MQLLSTPQQLEGGVAELNGASRYYIDTEFESSRQGKRLSLIQISCGEAIFIVDALRIADLRPLGDVICNPDTEWVLHAGLQDVELLVERFGGRPPPKLFDTQVLWALLGPEASVSLSFLQFRLLGIRGSKGYQADDWIRRPLPAAQLDYAAEDIAHLPKLADELRQRAQELGREHIIHETCRELLLPKAQAPVELTFESFRNAWQLDARGQIALRALIEWQNALPGRKAPLHARTLLAIAGRLPENSKALGRIKGVPPNVVRTHGRDLVARLEDARIAKVDPSALEPPAYASFDQNVREAELMLLRARLCAEISVAPELALPMALVRRMLTRAHKEKSLLSAAEELTGWRQALFGTLFEEKAAAVI